MSDADLLDGTDPSVPSDENASVPSGESAEAEGELLPETSAPPPVIDTRPPHHRRFRVTLVALTGIALVAVVVAVAVAANGNNRDGTASGGKWSSWTPSSSGTAGATEIAQYVAPLYRQSESKQLDVVTPIALTTPTEAGTTTGSGLTVAVDAGGASTPASSSSANSNLELLSGKTVAYNICGLGGKNCELGGRPSSTRLLLLRREALELALYTFKYVSGTDNVLVVLPPGKSAAGSKSGATPVTVAVLFLKQEYQSWLNVPFTRTLAAYPPPLADLTLWSKTTEASFVDQVTAHFLFSEQVASQQEGGKLLVLTQLASQ